MQLDDVIATTSPDAERMREAMERSIRWLDRCIAAHKKPATQNLFCIIQGGLDLGMRKVCCEEMARRDTPGIAIGGLSGGEDKVSYCQVYDWSNFITSKTSWSWNPQCKCLHKLAPSEQTSLRNGRRLSRRSPRLRRPRSGHVRLCLAHENCRTYAPLSSNPQSTDEEIYQRFGNAIVPTGNLNLRHASFANDFATIEADCKCPCCRPEEDGGLGITRAYIHHVAAKETAGAHLCVLPASLTISLHSEQHVDR